MLQRSQSTDFFMQPISWMGMSSINIESFGRNSELKGGLAKSTGLRGTEWGAYAASGLTSAPITDVPRRWNGPIDSLCPTMPTS